MSTSDKLAGLHPDLIAKVTRIINAMRELGFEMRVTDGLRTAQEQAALYAKGRGGGPGPIVTNADGTIKRSNHQASLSDGLGRAADLTFWVNGQPSWDVTLPWSLYGAMARALGLKWGGDWLGGLTDRPHVEMT